MRLINNCIKYDLYGANATIYVGGYGTHGTKYGLNVTILALLTCFICGVYFILEMFDTKKVNSFSSVINPSKPLSINFTSEIFYFGFAIQDPVTYDFILDESIYTVKGSYKIATKGINGSFVWETYPVELEPCQIHKFPQRYQKLFEKRDVNNMYCVKNFTYNKYRRNFSSR